MITARFKHLGAVIRLACREAPLLPIGAVLIVLTMAVLGVYLAAQIEIQIRAKLSTQASAGTATTVEQVGRVVDEAQRSLRTIAGLIRSHSQQNSAHSQQSLASDPVLITVAEQINLDSPQTAAIALIDAKGQARLLDQEYLGQSFDVSKRPYFPIAVRSSVDSFSYGPPTKNINTGSVNIPIMLKVEYAGEALILATAFAIDRLTTYLEQVAPGTDGIAAIVHHGDGTESAQFVTLTGSIEEQFASALLSAQVTTVEPRLTFNNEDYTFSIRAVETTPFTVAIGFSDAEAQSVFQQQLQLASVLYGIALLLLILAVTALLIFIGQNSQATRGLQVSEEHFRDLVEGSVQGIWIHQDFRPVFVNQAGAEMLGYTKEEFLAVSSVGDLLAPEERTRLRNFNAMRLRGAPLPDNYEFKALCKDGSIRVVLNAVRAVEWDNAPAIQCALIDITEAHNLSQRLEYEARHDELTGLINRRAFLDILNKVISARPMPGHAHVLCMLDLDQFKVVNDTCGHAAGDELLRRLGSLFHSKIRSTDTLARLGGDEFAVLLENCPLTQMTRVATALIETMDNYRFLWDDYSFKIGLSIGIVPIKQTIQYDSIHLLAQVDNACYVAKERGRNRYYVYDKDDEVVAQRAGEMRWVASFDTALAADRFFFVAQPILDLKNQKSGRHFELLLRMEAEDDSIVSPSVFFAAAERYNVATRIDRWVVDNALVWLAATPNLLNTLHLCNINLSAQTLADKSLCEYFKQAIVESIVPANKLCFEITETAAMVDVAAAVQFINELRVLGCHFALDDFGSGLSSFGYLKTLPIDFLKIDGQFVKDIARDPVDLAVVRSINEIGHEMGKLTVAEFVEDEKILALLMDMGIDFAQGYHIGKPQRIDLQTNDLHALDGVLSASLERAVG